MVEYGMEESRARAAQAGGATTLAPLVRTCRPGRDGQRVGSTAIDCAAQIHAGPTVRPASVDAFWKADSCRKTRAAVDQVTAERSRARDDEGSAPGLFRVDA